MRPLLDEEYAPITSEIGFLQLPHDDTVAAYVDWQERVAHVPVDDETWLAELADELGVTIETHYGPGAPAEPRPLPAHERATEAQTVRGTLRDALGSLLPLVEATFDRVLFVPTQGEWTAYFDNGWRGSDAFPPMSYLAQECGCRALRIVAVPPGGPRHAASVLEVYGPRQTEWLNVERAVSAIDDGGRWRFSAVGAPLPFEDVSRYDARRVRDRFPLELLEEYAAALGLQPFDDAFYMPDGVTTLVRLQRPFDVGRRFTLDEARADGDVPPASAIPATRWGGARLRSLFRRRRR